MPTTIGQGHHFTTLLRILWIPYNLYYVLNTYIHTYKFSGMSGEISLTEVELPADSHNRAVILTSFILQDNNEKLPH